MSSAERLFPISELAALYEISPRTIRYYEEVGLLNSVKRTTSTQQRYYTNEGRKTLKLILRGKLLGFSLEEIKEMIDLYNLNPSGEAGKQRIIEFSNKKLQEIELKITELELLKADILSTREKILSRMEKKVEES